MKEYKLSQLVEIKNGKDHKGRECKLNCVKLQ